MPFNIQALFEDHSQLLRWMTCSPEILRCAKEFELAMTISQMANNETKHHEQTRNTQKMFINDVQKLRLNLQ